MNSHYCSHKRKKENEIILSKSTHIFLYMLRSNTYAYDCDIYSNNEKKFTCIK